MILRQLRAAVLGAVLALTAVCGLTALTTMHDASFHDDEIAQLSVSHDHQPASPDLDNEVHLAAHAAGHWIGSEPSADRLLAFASESRRFAIEVAPALDGAGPTSLLRPPRA